MHFQERAEAIPITSAQASAATIRAPQTPRQHAGTPPHVRRSCAESETWHMPSRPPAHAGWPMRDGRRNRSRDAPRPSRRVCGGRGSGGYSDIIKKSMVKNGDGSRNSYHELYREHATVLPGGERRPTRSYGFTISESLACSRSLGRQHAGMSPYPVTSSGPPPGCRSSSGRRRGQASQQARVQYPRDAPAHLRHASAPLCLRPNWVPRSLSRFQ